MHAREHFMISSDHHAMACSVAEGIRVRLRFWAYVFHLLIPALLLFDVLHTWACISLSRPSEIIVVTLTSVWLVFGLGLLLGKRNRDRHIKGVSKPLIAMYSVYCAIGLIEIIGVLLWPRNDKSLTQREQGKWTLRTDPFITPGIYEPSTVTINSLGLRGSLPPHGPNQHRILAVGGSTTECLLLDDSKTWPQLLESELNERRRTPSVWIGNAGVAGHNTAHHLQLLRLIPSPCEFNTIIFLVGVNDLASALTFEGAPCAKYMESVAEVGLTRKHSPYYKRLYSYRLLYRVLYNRSDIHDCSFYEPKRRKRIAGPRSSLPDLSVNLLEYSERIRSLVRECQRLEARPIFVTQPTMYRPDLSAAEHRLLWLGGVGGEKTPKGFLSVEDLADAMKGYNGTLMKVCGEMLVECVDLAALAPNGVSLFYDDCHFNEEGARMVSKRIAAYLLERPPFRVQ
jgi:lysophospholipase L1-like esterase